MIVIAICTEGESSEPNYLGALKTVLFGTVALRAVNVEILTLPLGGNHGHRTIFERADEEIDKGKRNDNSLLSAMDPEDTIEKWLIVDYDGMDQKGISESEFRGIAASFGYELVINKPNFEFFVLCHFMSVDLASKVAISDFKKAIDNEIEKYNIERGFDNSENSALRLPKYSKNKNVARDLFWKMLDQNSELIEKMSKDFECTTADRYSEMWKIISRIKGCAEGTPSYDG